MDEPRPPSNGLKPKKSSMTLRLKTAIRKKSQLLRRRPEDAAQHTRPSHDHYRAQNIPRIPSPVFDTFDVSTTTDATVSGNQLTSSASILQHVTTTYDNGSSEADYSSLRSASSQDQRQTRPAQGLPNVRDLSELNERRLQSNDAFRRIDSHLTSTRRSDLGSDESESANDSQEYIQIPTQPPPASQPRVLIDHTSLMASDSGLANGHMHQRSVDSTLEALMFLPDPPSLSSEPNVEDTSSSTSTQQAEQSLITSQQRQVAATQGSSSLGTVDDPDKILPAPTTLEVTRSSSLGPSRWSDEFEEFDDYDQVMDLNIANEQARIEWQVANEQVIDTMSDTYDVPQGSFTEPPSSAEGSELYDRAAVAAQACQPVGHEGHTMGENESVDSRYVFDEPTHGRVGRQLLAPGQAILNAEIAIANLRTVSEQAQESLEQLIYEDYIRNQFIGLARADLAASQHELLRAHEGVRERDQEISRLVRIIQSALEETSSFAYCAPNSTAATADDITGGVAHIDPVSVHMSESMARTNDLTPEQRVSRAPRISASESLGRNRQTARSCAQPVHGSLQWLRSAEQNNLMQTEQCALSGQLANAPTQSSTGDSNGPSHVLRHRIQHEDDESNDEAI